MEFLLVLFFIIFCVMGIPIITNKSKKSLRESAAPRKQKIDIVRQRELFKKMKEKAKEYENRELYGEMYRIYMNIGELRLAENARKRFHEKYISSAEELFQNGQYEDAIKKINEKLKKEREIKGLKVFSIRRKDKKRIKKYVFKWAEELRDNKNYKEAGDKFKQIKEYKSAAECYEKAEEFKMAAKMYKKVSFKNFK